MPTASSAIQTTTQRLRDARLESPRREAELLVRAVAGLSKERLLAHPETELTAEEASRLETLVARRLRREPLPYLVGSVEFYSLPFRVGPAALIPRPETELLAEEAIRRAPQARLALDVGAGSGALAVVLARELPQAVVIAIDLSREALRLTRENAHLHGVSDRVLPVQADLLTAVQAQAELIVANLPYIRRGDLEGLQPEVRDFEPRLALDGGQDGLEVIRRLGDQLPERVRPGAVVALEVGLGQAAAVEQILAAAGLVEVETVPDYAAIGRVVIGRAAAG